MFAVFLGIVFDSAIAAETSSYYDKLTALAAKCDELGLTDQAEVTRHWNVPRHPGRQYLFLPADIDPTVPKTTASETIKQWHRRFQDLRRERAESLFADAKTASDQTQSARAYQLLHEVLREDSGHTDARRILGYVKIGSEWKLPDWEKASVRQPPFNHPLTLWRARSYWSLETPHFQIISNDQGELREAAVQLENLHTLWRQIFFRYWSSPEALAARFAGTSEPLIRERPKMQVVIFKTRQQYAQHVASAHPKAASTLGLYDDKQRIAFFFGGDKSVYPTWYHEATHQLFAEGIPGTISEPGQARSFWALEGAALYMESLAPHAGYWTAGGCEADRLQFARYRVMTGSLDLPLARIAALSRDDIQSSDDIGRIYTQAAGIAQFLIDGESGKHREAFVDLLTAIYRGEDKLDSLATLTGHPAQKLDEAYRDFLNVTDDDLAAIPDPSRLRNLSLCRTSITDQSLARFADAKNLQWLDLSFTASTDEGLKHFAGSTNLKQLFLEGSKVTDASLPLISGFKQLEALDLSRLPITDSGLAAIAGLRNLKTLYLTGCPVTDAGLVHLSGLKQLETLDTEGTKISADGFQKLRISVPKLNR